MKVIFSLKEKEFVVPDYLEKEVKDGNKTAMAYLEFLVTHFVESMVETKIVYEDNKDNKDD